MVLEDKVFGAEEAWYELSWNTSLHHVVKPLADWEWVCVAAHILVDLGLAVLIFQQWQRFGKSSPRLLKCSLAVIYGATVVSMPFAVMSTGQALTPQYTFPFYLGQFAYVALLNVSYLVLFVKQQLLYDSGIESIITEKLAQRRQILLLLFKLSFASYVVGIIGIQFVPTIRLIVLSETDTTQNVRVVYTLPMWVRILFAIGDTTISVVCLALFLIPVLAFQKVAITVSANADSTAATITQVHATKERLRQAAYINLKWTLVSTITTFLFLTLGGELLPEFSTVWVLGGGFDCLIKLFCLGKMFPQSSKNASIIVPATGRALASVNHQSSNFRSNDTGLSVVYHAPKPRRRSMRLFSYT